MVISFERSKSLSYFYRVFTHHSALSPAGVRHSESCLVGEDQRSVYDSNYLAIRLTNLPVFSFQSVPFSWEPLKWNGETFFAVFNFLYMACSSTLPNMRRPYRSFKKEGRRVFLLSFFLSAFTFQISLICFSPNYGSIAGFFFSIYGMYHSPFSVFCVLCFFPNYHAIHRYSNSSWASRVDGQLRIVGAGGQMAIQASRFLLAIVRTESVLNKFLP